MRSSRVLICGASIAGPALALWLARYGFEVTVVEKAASVRAGGQPVDFKGATHRTVLSRMGILEQVRAAAVGAHDGAIVDARGRRIGTVPGEFSGGEINVPRGDLASILLERTAPTCEYLFDDVVVSLDQDADGVDVQLAHGGRRRFDLVVGADGIHSGTRALAFGPENGFVSHLGYYYAMFSAVSADDEMYNEPGRMVATSGGDDPAFAVFASPLLAYDRDDVDQQQRLVVHAFRGAGWRVPELMAGLADADYFYFDSISRVSADRYASGRVVLLGDSAYGNALGGFGTGLAIVGAYVLAGELHRAGGDHAVAFAGYERRFRDYAKVSRKVNAGRLLAPSTRGGIYLRNRLFSVAPLFAPLMRLSDRFATDIELVDYEQAGAD
ncbi:FAD-dependent oxidoreductase [Nocardioides mangrovicus]|uniref:FAD-dependent oxidoreductase n=1 Tax=Nocardioides mangrovicus TaxID=2478913 RepID=A0A3L8P0N2_9ACTN|nr:FAD-dependent monooxygenase [Nocardioides mangrovicus]RLV48477.1 FAD-dependent oxidoreductase [Nocardioides mangrovicus]